MGRLLIWQETLASLLAFTPFGSYNMGYTAHFVCPNCLGSFFYPQDVITLPLIQGGDEYGYKTGGN
jgi:hypothetical protein